MTTVSYAEALRRAKEWTAHPSAAVHNGGNGGMCQKVSREIVGAGPFGVTALVAWHSIPESHRHSGTPRGGSIVYLDKPNVSGEAGHATWMEDPVYARSTDAFTTGRMDKIKLTTLVANWNMRYLGWIDWTPSGYLHLLPLATPGTPAPSPTLKYRQGKQVYSSKMHVGQMNSDSVWNIALALKARGFNTSTVVDDFTPALREKVAAYQRSKGWTGSDADGIPGPGTTTALGLTWVVG